MMPKEDNLNSYEIPKLHEQKAWSCIEAKSVNQKIAVSQLV